MAHTHNIHDMDARFVIDPVTRVINGKNHRKVTLIQGDHNSERFTFEIPRTVEGHDMSLCNVVEVHYLNIDSVTKEKRSGMYTVDDLKTESDVVTCSWLVSSNATSLVGSLNFLLKFKCVTGNIVEYAWNTAVFTGISISNGIDASESVEGEYRDIIGQWKAKVVSDITESVKADVSEWAETESGKLRGMMFTEMARTNSDLAVERARIDLMQSGAAADDAELIDIRVGADGKTYVSAGTAIREQMANISASAVSDFVQSGGADRYISNVEIYTDEYDHLMISDIRNSYNDTVGFSLFSCDANGENFATIRALHNIPVEQKRARMVFGKNSILIVDFDVSAMESGMRYTDTGLKSKIKSVCIKSRALYNEIDASVSPLARYLRTIAMASSRS